jgi:hypothetical protein
MRLELSRRLSLILLIVAVAIGAGVPAMQAGASHDQTVVAMSADAASGCAHESCPLDQNSATHANCFATCAGVTLLSPPAVGIVHFAIVRGIMLPSHDGAMVARNIPPDPHPPKQA